VAIDALKFAGELRGKLGAACGWRHRHGWPSSLRMIRHRLGLVLERRADVGDYSMKGSHGLPLPGLIP
jgi:hypothetical protein